MSGPLALRDFRLLFAARGVSYVGTYLAPIAVAFAILRLGGLAGLRWKPRVPMVTTGLLFMVTAVQNALLALHPSTALLTPAAAGAGFAFALGSVIWDTTLQRVIPPEKLARVASYGWMGAMVFLPAGYALAGPISTVIGLKADLLIAAGWAVASTLVVVRLPAVREVSYEPAPEAVPVPAQ